MDRRSGAWSVALCAVIVVAIPAAPAAAQGKPKRLPSRVFVQTNEPQGNAVRVFNRRKDGRLVRGRSYPTGSTGSGSLVAATPFPFTESQGSVTLSRDGRRLFVTNHGGNAVTSFRVTRRGLTRVSTVPSGGVAPLSVTVHPNGRLAYVVNEGNPATISGFRVTSRGALRPLSNSTRTLAYPAGAPAQVSFTPSGKALVVSDRHAGPGVGPDFIETFRVGRQGRPTALPPTPAIRETPFGFAFTKNDVLVMTYAGNDRSNAGGVGSFKAADSGRLRPVRSRATRQTATCWIVITKNQKMAFVSNTVSVSISAYRISKGGALKGANNHPAVTGVQGAPVELALSRDSKFLYAMNVDPTIILGDRNARSDIEIFKVGKGGALTSIDTAGRGLPTSVSGIAVW